MAGVPTTKLALLAVFVTVNAGEFTVVVTLGLQRAGNGLVAAAQPGSPPPRTVAALVTRAPAAAVGVTGITKLTVPVVAAKPAATVQVTTWPAAVQFAGNAPMVRPVGMVSTMVETAVVAALPVLVRVSV